MVATSPTVEIFCSYASEDEVWRQKLETHLSLLKRQGLVSLWHNRLILPGADWAQTIDTHLETASIILLLISANFFASDYCYGVEMKHALERHEAGEVRVVPLLVRPVDWQDAPFAHLHPLPTDRKPLSAWQDLDAALTDVVAGIRRVLEDLSLLAVNSPRTNLPAIWNIPYPRNPFFLGRESELAQIRQRLQAGQTTALSQPQAISGLGGIGKTQLALEYAYRYHQDYRAVLWARAENTEALISSYIAIAHLLRLPEREVKEQEVIVQAVKLRLQTQRDWLLILDNADELALLSDFLPPTLGGHLLLTTRAAVTGRLAHRLEIEILQPEQGALFLLRRAALIASDATLEHTLPQERALALQISQELGGLPLALDQAGAYLEETGANLADYWQLYQQHRTDLLRERRGLVKDHPLPVATTWSLSFQRVEERNPAAANLLRLLTFLASDAIAEEILTEGAAQLGPVLAPVAAEMFLLNQAIEVLRAYSLIQRDHREKMLSIHRMVQAVLQDALAETERQTWANRAMLAVNDVFPSGEYGTWSQCERLLSQALAVVQLIEVYPLIVHEATGQLLQKIADYLSERACYQEAKPLYQQVLHIWEQLLGFKHPQIAYPLNGLAILYAKLGKHAKAEQLFQQALHIGELKLESEEYSDVVYPLNNLAILYVEQGKYTEAELLYQRALHISEQQLRPEPLKVAFLLHNLALLYLERGKHAKAERLFQRALHIWERLLGPEHPNVAYPLNNLAVLYAEQGKYAKVEPLYQRALHISEQLLGPEHPDVTYPLNNLALFYAEQGKYAKAEPLYQRVLHIREQQLGPEHPDVTYPLNNLAVLYAEQGKYAKAKPLFQRTLRIREKTLGPQHPLTVEILHNFAIFWEVRGNSEEARTWYTRALARCEQVFGAHHPKTMETRTRFMALLHRLEQHEQAAQIEAVQPES